MFDFRYHALSLVAVLIALAVGLLLGVAIGDQGLVSSAERDLRAGLRSEVVQARDQAAESRRELAQRREVEREDFYPLMVGGRLPQARIGLLALGDADDGTVELVEQALRGTGAELASVSVVREPVDLDGVAAALPGEDATGRAADDEPGPVPEAEAAERVELARRLGRQVGLAFAEGGPLLARLRGPLLRLGSSSGSLDGLEGVVLLRRTPRLEGSEAEQTEAFEDALVDGLVAGGAPVVGAETSTATGADSQIPWFQAHNLSSVDSLDLLEGRAALVLALAGEKGTYGVKPTADALLPSLSGRTG